MSFRSVFYRYPEFLPIPLVLDGATGTSLQRRGMPKGASTELWIDENPEMIVDVQREFIDAGADVVNSPNFGGSRFQLSHRGVSPSEVRPLNRRLIGYSRAGIDARNKSDRASRPVFLTGNTAPTGRFLEPYGDASFDEIFDAYKEQAEEMEPAADLFYAETEISLAECRANVLAYKAVSDKPVMASFTIGEGGRTLGGDTPLCCLLTLAELGVNIFGFNCSDGPERIYDALKELVPYAAGLGVALLAKPNAGKPTELPDGSRVFSMPPAEFLPWISKIIDLGVFVCGGCCGTDGEYIKGVRELLGKADPDAFKYKAADSTLIACTNCRTAEIPPDAKKYAVPVSSIIDFDDFADNLEEDYAVLRLDSQEDADALKENLLSLNMPLCLTGDQDAIAEFTRVYCGKVVLMC